jgi:RNA polymerase sigma-70 factor (sigma-E family)
MSEGLEARLDGKQDFTAFVSARRPALLRFAYLATGDRSESYDLVQDALERAWPRWGALTRAGTCEAYVKRSIANGSVSRWRKMRRLVLSADPVGPDAAVVQRDDTDWAWDLCGGLPRVQRAAVVLRFYEDLPYDQIALVLDCAEATARSHVHRALHALRKQLCDQEDDDA